MLDNCTPYSPETRDNEACKLSIADDIQLFCESMGYEIIDTKNDGGIVVKRISCGHVTVHFRQTIRKNSGEGIPCKTCAHEQDKHDAESVGLKVITRLKMSILLCKTACCGAEIEFQLSQMRNLKKPYTCQSCQDKEHNKLTMVYGAAYISDHEQDRGNGYAKYHLSCCDHEQVIKRCHAVNGNFRCSGCNRSPWESPGQFYLGIITDGNKKILKMGHSINAEARAKKFLKSEVEIKFVLIVDFETKRDAHDFEEYIRNLKGVSAHSVSEKHAGLFLKYGVTEAYNLSALELLLKEIKEAIDIYEALDKGEPGSNKKSRNGRCDTSRKKIFRQNYAKVHAERAERHGWELVAESDKPSYYYYRCPVGHINEKSTQTFNRGTISPECTTCKDRAFDEKYTAHAIKRGMCDLINMQGTSKCTFKCKNGHPGQMKRETLLKTDSIYKCPECKRLGLF